MFPAVAVPRRRRREQRKYNTERREQIAVDGIEGAGAAGAELAAQRAFDEDVGRAQDVALRVDEPRDAGVGRAREGDPVLDGAEDHHGEVLVGRAGAAEPGVIGDRDHVVGALVDELPHEVREDHLEADDDAQAAAGRAQHARARPRHEVADADHQFVQEPQEFLQRDVLAEGHQVDLVVAVQHDAVSADQVRAVQQTQRAGGLARDGRASEQQGDAAFPHEGQQFVPVRGLHLEQERRGGFGPDHEIGAVGDLQAQPFVFLDRVPPVGGVPFLGLGHVGLDETDPHGVVAGRVFLGRETPVPVGQDDDEERRGEQPGGPGKGGRLGRRRHARHERCHDPGRDDVHEHQQEGDAVHARHVRHLDHRQIVELAVAEQHPGKAGEEMGARPFQRDPDDRCDPRPDQAPPVGGRRQEGAERPDEQRAVARQQQHQGDADGKRELPVLVHGVDDPGERAGEEEEPGQPALAERHFPGHSPDGEQQRDQGDPGQGPPVVRRKGQDEQRSGQGGEKEQVDEPVH